MYAVFAPTAAIHSLTAVATNSGPLSERMGPGTPRPPHELGQDLEHLGRAEPALDADCKRLAGELVDDARRMRNVRPS